MQIEAKITLGGRADYDKLLTLLAATGKAPKVVQQRNNFFDGPGAPLAALGAILRLRLESNVAKGSDAASIAIKERSEVDDGSNVRYVCSETLTFVEAQKNFHNPVALVPADGKVAKALAEHCRITREHLAGFTSLGGFDNERRVYAWPGADAIQDGGLNLHVDRTTYPFGERFEVEVPNVTVPVHDVLSELASLLDGQGIAFTPSTLPKFQLFLAGVAKQHEATELAGAKHMKCDAKVLLRSQDDAAKLVDALQAHPLVAAKMAEFPAGALLRTDLQHNVFFDDASGTLTSRGAYLRVRVTGDGAGRCFAVLKQFDAVSDGTMMSWQQEEELPSFLAEHVRAGQGDALLRYLPSQIGHALANEFGVKHLVSLGGFDNERRVYAWPGADAIQDGGLNLHVDRTTYPFGERFEVEVPNVTVPVHDVLSELASLLNGANAAFTPCEKSKFEVFRAGMAMMAARGPAR